MNSKQKLGKKIRAVRKNKNLTQTELAAKAGINGNYYACIERGEVNLSFEVLESIVKALKIKSSDILPF